jgi:GNAT superfamily N-acetyltransferase
MSGQAVERAARCQLLDGRLVSMRRLGADDTEAVLALHQHLSDHDRYFRFFTLHPVHLDQLVGKLVEAADGEYALGAFDADRLIGVANYTTCTDPSVAEMAIVVAHEDHSLGVGTALLRRLAQIAATHGIRRFVADILTENHLMFQVLSDLGWQYKRLTSEAIRHLEIELPKCVTEVSTAAGEVSSRGVRNVPDYNKTRNIGLRRRIGGI